MYGYLYIRLIQCKTQHFRVAPMLRYVRKKCGRIKFVRLTIRWRHLRTKHSLIYRYVFFCTLQHQIFVYPACFCRSLVVEYFYFR